MYRIVVIGDYRESNETHPGTTDALRHAAEADGDECQVTLVRAFARAAGGG